MQCFYIIMKFKVNLTYYEFNLAERKGFEPSTPRLRNTRFPGVRLRPLGHLSFSISNKVKICCL